MIRNSQRVETTISLGECIHKTVLSTQQNAVRHRKEQTTGAPQRGRASETECRNVRCKVHLRTVCPRLRKVCRKGTRSARDRKQMSGCLRLGGSWELLQMGTTEPCEMTEILYSWVAVKAAHSKLTKNH